MQRAGKFVGLWAVSNVVMGALAACGPPPEPVFATIQVPTLRVHGGQTTITKDGLTVDIKPIMGDTVRQYSQIYQTVEYTAMVRPKNMFGQEDPTQPLQPVQGKAETSIVPLPCFKVSVENHTGHVLRFTTAVFRLQDGRGQSYELFQNTDERAAWLEAMWNTTPGFGPEVANQVMRGLKAKLAATKFLDHNTELLDGDPWSGYLVFNLNTASAKDTEDFVASLDRLTLRLAELPISMDDAGKVNKTTEFSFVVDKTTAPLRVKCPPGTTEPSASICSKEM